MGGEGVAVGIFVDQLVDRFACAMAGAAASIRLAVKANFMAISP